MVNPYIFQRHEAHNAPMVNLIDEVVNGSSRCAKRRKQMGNAGFMRSDLWRKRHGYSMTTVNKYRGKLYGDEMFLGATPSTKGKQRIANAVADILRENGVHSRKRDTKPVKNPAQRSAERVEAMQTVVDSEKLTTMVIYKAVREYGTESVFDMLLRADKFHNAVKVGKAAG